MFFMCTTDCHAIRKLNKRDTRSHTFMTSPKDQKVTNFVTPTPIPHVHKNE